MANIDATTPQLKVVKDWTDAYFSLDINRVEPFLSKNFKFQTFPKIMDVPEEGKAAHIQRYKWMFGTFEKAEVTIHEVIEAPGRVVMRTTSVCSIADGPTLDYDNVLILSLAEEDGKPKIVECTEFCDPQKRSTLFDGVSKAAAKGLPAL